MAAGEGGAVMTMLERAARAARQAEDNRLGGILGSWEGSTDEMREAWRGIVRAVLLTTREPSDDIKRTAWGHPGSDGDGNPMDTCIYQALIDEILAERL